MEYAFKLATIKFAEDRDCFINKARAGQIHSCSSSPALEVKDIQNAEVIVAQMGAEPWMKALEGNPDIIISGRSYDPAPFAAFSMYRGVQESSAWHMGKIMECGGLCATPKSQGAVATVFSDGTFEIAPTDLNARCTPTSVAAHALYENPQPDLHFGPGGHLDSGRTEYEQLRDGRTTRVRGGKFVSAARKNEPYTVKLEGARSVGYRSMYVGAIRDRELPSKGCRA